MSTGKRKTFSPEFKREAVCLLENGEKDAAQLARELGIRRIQLYKWKTKIDAHGNDAFPGKGGRPKTARKDEAANLKAEIKRLREENEILKKAPSVVFRILCHFFKLSKRDDT
ncbi:MAG: transposase [Gammaproteobacteria bacterium]